MAHTPTPWFTSDDAVMAAPYGEDVVVATCEERTCAGDNGLAEACDNARLIVTAVNGFEAMREALAGIKWRSADKDNMEYTARITYAQMEAIDTALAKAKAMP